MKSLTMTHTAGLQLLKWLQSTGDPRLNAMTEILVDAIAEAEEAAICDDVFIPLDDSESWNVKLAAMIAGVEYKVF